MTDNTGASAGQTGLSSAIEPASGLAPSGFDSSRKKPQKPVKAFAVCETDERSGAIYFARHAIVARKAGANEYGDGELSYVTCNRAPWADQFAATGIVPAAVMVEHGWHFECASCGARIDDDLPYRWRDRAHGSFRDLLQQARRWRRWSPGLVRGSQHSTVFCDKRCEDNRAAAASQKVAERLTLHQRLACQPVDRSYSRIVARCTLADGRSLTCALIAAGAATRWDRYWRRYGTGECR